MSVSLFKGAPSGAALRRRSRYNAQRMTLNDSFRSALIRLGIEKPDLLSRHQVRLALASTNSGHIRSLLGSSHKTDLGVGLGYNTRILYMSPWKEAGLNSCPFSSPGCRAGCLISSGRMVTDQCERSRISKRLLLALGPDMFRDLLHCEIRKHEIESDIKELGAVVRLNGTTDLDPRSMVQFEDHPMTRFMDYTKRPVRSAERLNLLGIPNYDLTFSLDETPVSRMRADQWLERGHGVAVVVGSKQNDSKEAAKNVARAIVERGELWGLPAVDGDAHDLRFLDPAGPRYVILSAKGKALRDRSGFVHRFHGGA